MSDTPIEDCCPDPEIVSYSPYSRWSVITCYDNNQRFMSNTFTKQDQKVYKHLYHLTIATSKKDDETVTDVHLDRALEHVEIKLDQSGACAKLLEGCLERSERNNLHSHYLIATTKKVCFRNISKYEWKHKKFSIYWLPVISEAYELNVRKYIRKNMK